MFLTPILTASPIIQIHLIAALLAAGLGPFALYRRKRDRLHRRLGYAWVAAMTALALSSFWIEATLLPIVGPFGAIHLFSVMVLVSLLRGVCAARAGRVSAHSTIMRDLYRQAMAIAVLLTLAPGRLLNRTLFGEASGLGWVAIALGLGVIALILVRNRLRPGLA